MSDIDLNKTNQNSILRSTLDAQKRCQNLVENALSTPYYYFTYQGGDLTNTKQRQSLTDPDSESDWKRADKRFLWNYHMGTSLLQLASSGDRSKISPFLVLLIHGAVFIHRCKVNGVSR